MVTNKIVGAVFPLPHKMVERLLSKEKDIFAKFGRFKHLSKGQKLLFYDSSIHAIVGEAAIEEVIYADPSTVRAKYGSRLFLDSNEFGEYIAKTPLGSRDVQSKIMTICILKNPKRYQDPQKPAKKMNMIGHYIYE
jgi:hypothetical protein